MRAAARRIILETHHHGNVLTRRDETNVIETSDPRANPRGRVSGDPNLDWLLLVLRERRCVIFAASLLGAAVAVLYLSLATPRYLATARILIDDQRPRVTSGQEIIPYPRFDLEIGRA